MNRLNPDMPIREGPGVYVLPDDPGTNLKRDERRQVARQNRLDRFAHDHLEDLMAQIEFIRNMPSGATKTKMALALIDRAWEDFQ